MSDSATGASEAFARLRLIRTPDIGPSTFHALIRRFGSASAALNALPHLKGPSGRPWRPAPVAAIDAELERLGHMGARIVHSGGAHYPAALMHMANPPPVLTLCGAVHLLDRPCVAIVGARNASAASLRIARMLGEGLVEHGALVVSGLARGVDTAAHQGAIGATAGVIGNGMALAFPPDNRALQDRIAREGVLISEHAPDTPPIARAFPARNRIIAGMALGALVVEAAPHSGSLITARIAGELGRAVMAIPGHPLDPRSAGTNMLIREGATLIQSIEDVIEILSPLIEPTLFSAAFSSVTPPVCVDAVPPAPGEAASDERSSSLPKYGPAAGDLMALLSATPVPVDDLVRLSGRTAATVAAELSALEIDGTILRHAGGRVSLAVTGGS